ncbi:PIN-like domain-containing protein [Rathayibacter sp. CAU 1779]
MPSTFTPVYFADENCLAFGKLLRRNGRNDVLYPGHEDLPEVPLGTADLEWMPVVGARAYVVITRDRHIRTRPAELDAYIEHGIRSIWIGAKRDLGPQDQVDVFLANEARLRREIIKLGGGPWSVALSPSGVRPLRMRANR